MRGVAEPHRDLALHVEGQPLFGTAGKEMQVAAHRPQEIRATAEGAVFRASNTPRSRSSSVRARGRHIRDPEQRMQVAQPPLPSFTLGSTR